jgi:hypothetical protein
VSKPDICTALERQLRKDLTSTLSISKKCNTDLSQFDTSYFHQICNFSILSRAQSAVFNPSHTASNLRSSVCRIREANEHCFPDVTVTNASNSMIRLILTRPKYKFTTQLRNVALLSNLCWMPQRSVLQPSFNRRSKHGSNSVPKYLLPPSRRGQA